jgi:hypothetical protein
MIARPHSVVQHLEFHYTLVHRNWLNMAEIEIGIFERGCLSQPLEGLVDLRQRTAQHTTSWLLRAWLAHQRHVLNALVARLVICHPVSVAAA